MYVCMYVCMYACMHVCMPNYIILKGIWNMTAKEAAVRMMMEDNLSDVPEPGDQVTQFFLYNADG